MKVELAGTRFGRLVVVERSGVNRHRKVVWECHCDCGGMTLATTGDLRRKDKRATRSCGCIQRENTGDANRRHGLSDTRVYTIWRGMHRRCSDPRCEGWENYGGRGIAVCDRWRSLENFVADMGEPPDDRTLDRIDNDGNYEPTNCRWATYVEQARGNIKYLTLNDETLSIREWAAKLGLTRPALTLRLAKAPLEVALTAEKWAKPKQGEAQVNEWLGITEGSAE